MDWPIVVKTLRASAQKDASRSADMQRTDPAFAMELHLMSLLSNRLAEAFEAGHVAAGVEPVPESVPEKRGRPRKVA
ncbi:hypothetical protein KEU06_09175 [Pseudaminobacter sp. 19-2017]|uniref:Uncharacterized protein n=1 Tax=Pseudaminobacter soli (ex Zhang et al. 2022) TaxID=2831468 RepID=A0A942E0T1_9HYPH|nr:hypothetical protein [Pseudaminobacter soli]MBS3648775.1 hypothetical protein [Pseudaminobacter soli]